METQVFMAGIAVGLLINQCIRLYYLWYMRYERLMAMKILIATNKGGNVVIAGMPVKTLG